MRDKIRSFVAIDTSIQVKGELAHLVSRLQVETGFPVKWVKPEQMHITLAFLGEVTREFIQSAESALREAIVDVPSFSCRLLGLGAFPVPARARVIWVGVETGAAKLIALQKKVVRALQAVGYIPENRPFKPHLTLGRIRVPADAGFITAISFVSSQWPVSEVTIYRSELLPDGPVYTPIVRLPLHPPTVAGRD